MRSRTAFLLDAVSVIAFVAIGRASHDDGLLSPGSLVALAPFAIALAFGWVLMRAWRRPTALATGAAVWAVTAIGGVLLRSALPGRDLEPSFVIVTAVFLALTMLGWRGVNAVARGTRAAAKN
jgi:FtsH-binding integral membrane protein